MKEKRKRGERKKGRNTDNLCVAGLPKDTEEREDDNSDKDTEIQADNTQLKSISVEEAKQPAECS